MPVTITSINSIMIWSPKNTLKALPEKLSDKGLKRLNFFLLSLTLDPYPNYGYYEKELLLFGNMEDEKDTLRNN